MDSKILILLVFLVAFCQSVFAGEYFTTNLLYQGDVYFELGKEAYLPGEELQADFVVSNMEEFPLMDVYLVVEVVEGGKEHVYPSQDSDTDNVFYEEVLGPFDIDSESKATVPFSYTLPADLKRGEYRLEAYVGTKKTAVVGIPAIFLAPQHRNFEVESKGTYPYAKILRTQTYFWNESTVGPVGTGVVGGDDVEAVVFIQGAENAKFTNLELEVKICSWDDSLCSESDAYQSRVYPVLLSPSATKEVDISFEAPENPDAYSVRMELKEGSGRTISLYRGRIVVYGESAKIRKMAIDKPYYKEGDSGKIMLLLSASPDTFTNPVVENAEVSVSVESGGELVYSDSAVIPRLSVDKEDEEISYQEFNFTAPSEMRVFTVCSKISVPEKTYDEYCYNSTASIPAGSGNTLTVEWSYDYESKTLTVGICSEDFFEEPSDSFASLVVLEEKDGLFRDYREGVELSPCGEIEYTVAAGAYDMLVNEDGTNNQFEFVIDIPPGQEGDVCGDGACSGTEDYSKCCSDCGCPEGEECLNGACSVPVKAFVCGDGVCSADENSKSCCSDCGCPEGGRCLDGVCRSGTGEINTVWYLLIIAIIFVAALMYFQTKKRGGKK